MAKQNVNKQEPLAADANAPKAPSTEFDDVISELQLVLGILQALIPNLTPAARKRMSGAGTRRYGFIDRTMDYAMEFPQFVPSAFDIAALRKAKVHIEVLRDIQILSEQINKLISDGLLVNGNAAYDQALIYYNSVRELSKRNVPGAKELYEHLNSIFKRKRSADKPETEMEQERDAIKLIHGKADGEMVIRNERPHMTGGVHEVIDDTHKSATHFKATEEGAIED